MEFAVSNRNKLTIQNSNQSNNIFFYSILAQSRTTNSKFNPKNYIVIFNNIAIYNQCVAWYI